ncbi:hypothetical protein P3T37_006475 [Kitasatospora sp. MAA4]|uniref:DUF3592 domain-containing protein n=1 Tax=Kitasatospora sp. MAA4 TaxID=3035093 RepID=UPI0024738940|nr:DUF3592 domain-containing protein [Kitasatospora sp. MAA4]MDH6137044.1 hypothetical protein [Kitasatospora sp. MAA4]
METPTAVLAGSVLALFGGALLLWCAAEFLLRHQLRRHGIPATALVVADEQPGQALDPAPLLAYATLPSVFPASDGSGGRGESVDVLARPRGGTPLRRPAGLVPGSAVRVSYDPRRPARVVLTGAGTMASLPVDVFWTILGTSSLAGGLSLLASVLVH